MGASRPARPADLRDLALFGGLSDEQIADLASAGAVFGFELGDILFTEGQPAEYWWVLLSGTVDLIRHVGREDAVVAQMDVAGRWAGGFRAWDDAGTYLATGRVAHPGEVFRLPAEALRERFAAWFPFGAHLIGGLYHTARSIDATARQRSSLITLGTLAAGLAHELNNPAAAATRAADSLESASRSVLQALGWLSGNNISAAQFSELDRLRVALAPAPSSLDALERADREDALLDWLRDKGMTREPWVLAGALTTAGADPAWCARVERVLPGPDLEPALHWVASTAEVRQLLGEVRESTGRIFELVAAMRSYSQLDRASRQRVRVSEGLDSTLVMLGHKVGGVSVLRDYASDLPELEGYPGELNQVWTNLIDNALDAMDGAGTLRVSTRADGGQVLVEICDTGPGMPPAVAARAFEPFFTTKEVGRGTGLGLDIARRVVVERHGGAIGIESVPGDTRIQVRLPLG
ncbi:MAG TPA: ATP-binding protein [Micropruina sp.]|nr:ATP-binding protein [Micropruina sp.]